MTEPTTATVDPNVIERDAQGRKIYRPDGVVLRQFLRDRSHVSIVRGSIGSGTSTACVMKMFAISMEQRPGPDGLRRTRWFIVRNTFPDLKNTTVKTWLDWFPEEIYGRFYWDRPYKQIIRVADMEMEVLFLALDSADDVRKLRSAEVTGIWINELEFIDKEILDEAESRTGRFPAVKDGGATWDGVIADMNAPREDHFVPLMMGEVELPEDWTEEERLAYRRPAGWGYFVQPPALLEQKSASGEIIGYEPNPAAENTRWLKPGYYMEKMQGKSKQWIDSRVLNRITVFVDGEPVWKQFNRDTHVAKETLKPLAGWPVYVGLDFGRRPAAVIGQLVNNRWRVIGEVTGRDMGSTTFAPLLKRHLDQLLGVWRVEGDRTTSQGFTVHFYGDPKGRDGTQADETTAYDVFDSFGMPVQPAPVKNNHILTRIEAVDFVLTGMANGLPRFLLSPVCRTLRVAMEGAYHYARIKGTGRVREDPEKDRYSDIADALQYLVLGAGEGRAMTGLAREALRRPINTRPEKKSRRRFG